MFIKKEFKVEDSTTPEAFVSGFQSVSINMQTLRVLNSIYVPSFSLFPICEIPSNLREISFPQIPQINAEFTYFQNKKDQHLLAFLVPKDMQ
jgi:hypothetical protein